MSRRIAANSLLTNTRQVDPEQIIEEVDLDTLESLVESFTSSSMTEEDLDCVSAGRLLKVFTLFQLLLEHQVDSTETLSVHVNSLSERLTRKNLQLKEMKQTIAERDAMISSMKQEMREITEATPRPDPVDTANEHPSQELQRHAMPVEDISPVDSGLVRLSVVVTSEGLVLVSVAANTDPIEL